MFLSAFGSSRISQVHPTDAAVEATKAIAANAHDNNFFMITSFLILFILKYTGVF